MEYIPWLDSSNWNCKIMLGSERQYYDFHVIWNSRDESFAVTISTMEGIVIIDGRKMVLEVDLLEHCFSEYKPSDCMLYPIANNELITHITYENMNDGEVKLYQIMF